MVPRKVDGKVEGDRESEEREVKCGEAGGRGRS